MIAEQPEQAGRASMHLRPGEVPGQDLIADAGKLVLASPGRPEQVEIAVRVDRKQRLEPVVDRIDEAVAGTFDRPPQDPVALRLLGVADRLPASEVAGRIMQGDSRRMDHNHV